MTGYEYAGFWVRLGATLVDWLLLMVVTAPLLAWAYGWEHLTSPDSALIAGPADFIISWILPAIAVICFWYKKQATPGKMAVACKIVDAYTGEKASVKQLLIRYASYCTLFVGFIWVIFDPRKQGLHDKLAGTVVIRACRSLPVEFQGGKDGAEHKET